jgi:hypothetical protein
LQDLKQGVKHKRWLGVIFEFNNMISVFGVAVLLPTRLPCFGVAKVGCIGGSEFATLNT